MISSLKMINTVTGTDKGSQLFSFKSVESKISSVSDSSRCVVIKKSPVPI